MRLIFRGVVQGVGFRPTVFRTAKELGLKGYVLNRGSEVEVVIDRKKEKFIEELKKRLPSTAKIEEIVEEQDNRYFSDFKILYSRDGTHKSVIPADIAICDECRKEIFDKNNKRYLFPFTNCTVCGARFSLIEDVPYDRDRTSMKHFKLCKSCEEEYKNPLDRRYHAQTISCPRCGPCYTLYDKNRRNLGSRDAIKRFARSIDKGKFCVIKSWGGMHLCCKTSEVERFRKWYKRPQKPFAIMVRDIKTAEKYGKLSKKEKELLQSEVRPIVLVEKKGLEGVSPGLNTVGLFLPYTGLHFILFSCLESDALIMTSANTPGEAMITDNDEIFSINADYYLLHNRPIPNRIDDSVIKVWKDKTFFLRKSRGYIPSPIYVSYSHNIISVGAGENVTGAVSSGGKLFSTQYIGDSKYYSTLSFLEDAIKHMMKLTMDENNVDAIAVDLHPAYETRKVAKKLSEEFSSEIYEIQHHFAHSASLMIDNNIEEAIVITLDGLGYGNDGNFWGGEIIYSTLSDYKRLAHLEYIPLIGGDQATRDPRRILFAIFKKLGETKYFSEAEIDIFSKLINKSPLTSSFGRILDALSCYLNICCIRTYEGEPAMKLEKYLAVGKESHKFDTEIEGNVIKTVNLFGQLDNNISKELTEGQKADYAYSFVKSIVNSLAEIAISFANDKGIKNIGLSGGVSYNIPITEMFEKIIKKSGLKFITHSRVPNGDCGISIGQNVIVGNKL